jgi:hypothetical protein
MSMSMSVALVLPTTIGDVGRLGWRHWGAPLMARGGLEEILSNQ